MREIRLVVVLLVSFGLVGCFATNSQNQHDLSSSNTGLVLPSEPVTVSVMLADKADRVIDSDFRNVGSANFPLIVGGLIGRPTIKTPRVRAGDDGEIELDIPNIYSAFDKHAIPLKVGRYNEQIIVEPNNMRLGRLGSFASSQGLPEAYTLDATGFADKRANDVWLVLAFFDRSGSISGKTVDSDGSELVYDVVVPGYGLYWVTITRYGRNYRFELAGSDVEPALQLTVVKQN